MNDPIYGTITEPMQVKSSLEQFREPARRFVRAQHLTGVKDAALESEELQMRCLIAHNQYPVYPQCSDPRIVRIYEMFLYRSLAEMLLCLYTVGNTHEEVSEKAGVPVDDLKLFCYFFCNEDYIALPKPAKTAVLTSQGTFHKSFPQVLMALNMDKLGVDVHFNLVPSDVKKHASRMKEVVTANQFYLATKDVHYVKPGQKSYAAVQDAMERSISSLKDLGGGEKSGTIELVMKQIEGIKGTITIVPAKDVEELNLPTIEDMDLNTETEEQEPGGVA